MTLKKKFIGTCLPRIEKKRPFFGYSFIYKMKTESHTKIIQCFLKGRIRQLSEFVNKHFWGGLVIYFQPPTFFYPGFLPDLTPGHIYIYIYMARSQVRQESRVRKMWGAEKLWPNPPKNFSFTNSESWRLLLFKKHWMIFVRLSVFIL